MKKHKIYCIVGKSGSGKDTITREIVKKSKLREIPRCTTRPKRKEEVEGREYHFLDKKDKDEMICQTVFHTKHGDWYYGFTKEPLDENNDYIAVMNLEQVLDIIDIYQEKFKICVFNIITDEETRIIHLIDREDRNGRDYEEVCRRIRTDAYDFSEKNSAYRDVHKKADVYYELYNDYESTPEEIAADWDYAYRNF